MYIQLRRRTGGLRDPHNGGLVFSVCVEASLVALAVMRPDMAPATTAQTMAGTIAPVAPALLKLPERPKPPVTMTPASQVAHIAQ